MVPSGPEFLEESQFKMGARAKSSALRSHSLGPVLHRLLTSGLDWLSALELGSEITEATDVNV